MRIDFVGQVGLETYLQEVGGRSVPKKKKAGITVFAFRGDEVYYDKELKGETRFFEQIAKLSKAEEGLVVCPVVTNTRGHRRKSSVVAENGRILGVSDALRSLDGDTHSGAYLRVYEGKIGRAGVVVAEDIYDIETVKTLSLCGCDFIVCPFEEVKDSFCSVLLRAYAFLCGVPIFFCGAGCSMIADVDGSLAFSSPLSPVSTDFTLRKEFHLLEIRRKIYLKGK